MCGEERVREWGRDTRRRRRRRYAQGRRLADLYGCIEPMVEQLQYTLACVGNAAGRVCGEEHETREC